MYKSAICHLHSSFEGTASIEGYCYEAAKHGIDVVWLSDHDTRIPGKPEFYGTLTRTYDFSKGLIDSGVKPTGKQTNGLWRLEKFNHPDCLEIDSNGSTVVMKTTTYASEWAGASLRLDSLKNSYRYGVLGEPEIILDLDPSLSLAESENGRVLLTVYLSQHPPEHTLESITYVLGERNPGELPLVVNDNKVHLDIVEDIKQVGLNLDNTITGIEVRLESRNAQQVHIGLKHLQIELRFTEADKLLQAQQVLGQKIGQEYGVDVVVNNEVSGAECHMTCFGEHVPVFPYEGLEKPSCEEVHEHIKQHNGLLSINHPLSSWKRDKLTGEEKLVNVQARAKHYIERNAFNLHMIEIGFPSGRDGFEPEYYLMLWDMLNLAGMQIYGIGVSDAHKNIKWDSGNNYAVYIAAKDCSVKSLVEGMRSGDMYMADPVLFKGTLDFVTDQGKRMGDTQNKGTIKLSLTDVPLGSELNWVVDGKSAFKTRVEGEITNEFDFSKGKHFVRAEVRDASRRLIVLTNPLWIRGE